MSSEKKTKYRVQIYVDRDGVGEFYVEDFDGNIENLEKLANCIKSSILNISTIYSSKIELKYIKKPIIKAIVDIQECNLTIL